MRADLRIAWLAGLAAAALSPAMARAQAGSDLPPPAALSDPLVASCRLQGTPGAGEACGAADPSCSQPSHLINLLSYLSSHPRPAPGAAPAGGPPPLAATCDASMAPKDQSLDSAYRCFDDEFNPATMPRCQRVAVLDSPYASVLRPSQRTLAEADIPAAVQRGVLDAHCSAATTLCLDRDGAPIGAGKLLQKGDRLTVLALSVHAVDVGAVSITVAGVRATDALTSQPAVPPGPKGAAPGDVVAYVLAAALSDPIGDDVRTVRVTFRRDDPAHGRPIEPPPLDLSVERGRFYVDFGLALPFVVHGKRVVAAPALVQETTAPRVSFSAIVFPAGRHKDEIRVHGTAAWGIQIGTDFDFTRSVDQKDYYAGVAWEPIAGFGIAAGAALVRGEFIPAGAGPPDLSYIVRPYIGVFLTPDFVSSARAAVTALEAK